MVAPVRRVAVLGGGERWLPGLVQALPSDADVVVVPDSAGEASRAFGSDAAWTTALEQIETADVVVVAVGATAVGDPAWTALVDHAVAWRAGLVVVLGDGTPLAQWPAALRDAMPPTVELADPAWPAELLLLVLEARPDRADPWTPPARPPRPASSLSDGGPATLPPPVAQPPSFDPPPPAGWPGADDEPTAFDEDVQFTVYRPSAVPVQRWSWLLVFAHKSQSSAEEPDPLAEVRRQAEGVLGEQASTYGSLSADSTGPLRRGSTLLIEPWLEGATFNPPTVELRWEEPVHRADFRFRVGDDAPSTARGGVRVFVGAVLVGELSLSVRVGERPQPQPLRTSTRRFRKVFASYSHHDVEVVEAVANAVQLLGDDYLIDSHDLRSGEDWQQRISELIEDADVFQLFWSSNALQSQYVLDECRHALALRREGFIRPVYWQDPFPEDAAHDLPPPPIRRLHFSRLSTQTHRHAVALPPPAPGAPAAPVGPAAPVSGAAPPPPPPPVSNAPVAAAPATPTQPPPPPEFSRIELDDQPMLTTAPPEPPVRPRAAGPARSARRARRLATWGAVAAGAVLVVGVGSAALRAGDHDSGNSSSPATTRVASDTTSPDAVPSDTSPATEPIDTTTPPLTSGDTAFDRAVAYLGALPATTDPSCRLTAANPSLGTAGRLEEVGVDCTQTSPGGARVDVRRIVLKPGVAVQQYLDGLASAPGLQVTGGSLPSDPLGPYLDLTGRLQDGSSYSCRAWGLPPVDDQTNAVAIACSGAMADVIDVWRADHG